MAVTRSKPKPAGRSAKGRSGSKRKGEPRSSSTAPAAPKVTKEDAAKVSAKPAPAADRAAEPGWTVTVRGGLPDIFCGLMMKKGPIRASSREAAIGQFVAEISTQLKSIALLDIEAIEAVESHVPVAPTLPFQQKSDEKKPEPVKSADYTTPSNAGTSSATAKATIPALATATGGTKSGGVAISNTKV